MALCAARKGMKNRAQTENTDKNTDRGTFMGGSRMVAAGLILLPTSYFGPLLL